MTIEQPGPWPYRPSNGVEGDAFEDQWCRRCAGYFGGHCTILQRVQRYEIEEPEYPTQWLSDASRPWGHCTSFLPWSAVTRKNGHKSLPGQGVLF